MLSTRWKAAVDIGAASTVIFVGAFLLLGAEKLPGATPGTDNVITDLRKHLRALYERSLPP